MKRDPALAHRGITRVDGRSNAPDHVDSQLKKVKSRDSIPAEF